MSELVSIISPAYNTALYIAEMIRSVQAQTYTNWELLIVDDCSTDGTDQIIASFLKDPRIRHLRNPHKKGAALSRNYALREARGKWIAFLDSDDLWLPRKLEKQLAFMKEHNYHFSYTRYNVIDAKGNPTGDIVSGPRAISTSLMQRNNWLGCLTVMYDQERVGLIQIPDIPKSNDYAMWLQVCKKADCYLLEETLAAYRRGRIGSIRSHQSVIALIMWQYRFYRKAEELNILFSVGKTCLYVFWALYKKIRYERQSNTTLSEQTSGAPSSSTSKI